ncbi:MAG: transcriptional regulator PpsR [Tagaea sp.]
MVEFSAPARSFGDLHPDTAAALIAASCDLALVLDGKEIVRDVSIRAAGLADELAGAEKWVGRKWAELVTPESRAKIAALLREAEREPEPKWRHVNYPGRRGADIPIQHAAVRMAGSGRVVVFGRDLRGLSALQQRLADSQYALERDLARVRKTEQRYRLLFQYAPDPIVVIEGAAGRVVDANPVAQRLLSETGKRASARTLAELVAPAGRKAVEAALERVRAGGTAESVDVELAGGAGAAVLAICPFGHDATPGVFVRVAVRTGAPASERDQALDAAPDAIVLLDADGKIRRANAAFAELAQLPSPGAAAGEPLDRWIGPQGTDCDVLLSNLRQRGAVRLFATSVRGERGASTDVEINAIARGAGKDATLALSLRGVEARPSGGARRGGDGARTPEQLAELIGRVSLKDLVRESTDTIERMCIEAALDLTRDNRASAAELLGLSRQSLYVKLRRYGLAEAGESDDA